MFNNFRRLLAWATGSAAVGTSRMVDAFMAGASVREVAYTLTTGDDWPRRVRTVESELRAHIERQEAVIAELEGELAELR